MSTQRSQTATPEERSLLALGFLSLTGAILVAHASPATGYELSLYAETPIAVWALLGVSFSLSLALALSTRAVWLRRLALCLGAAATLAVVGMPVLRGYWFISGGDAHTHLGWTRGIASGAFHPLDLRYPGLHTVTTLLGSTLGIELAHAMMLVILVLCGLFFLFVTLSTSLVFESRYSTIFGAFSAFLLLPITTLSTHIPPHAMSQAILFSAVVIFLLLTYVRQGQNGRFRSAYGFLAAVALIALVLFHPQLAAHLLVVMVAICGLQFLARHRRRSGTIANHPPIYGLTTVLTLAFLAWSASHELIQSVVRFHLVSTVEYLFGRNDVAGDSADAQADSLAAIGGSLVEIVLKILGPSLVFGLLSGLLVLWAFLGMRTRTHRHTQALIQYFTVGLVGLSVLFFLYFFGSSGSMYFRVFGFMMLFITIMGAVVLAYVMESITRTGAVRTAHAGIAVVFAVLLVVSLVAVFPSPYIYKPSPHVTEQSMSGYEVAFDRQDEDVTFVGIRAGPNRQGDAISADLDRTRSHGMITGSEIENGITHQYTDERYLSITQKDMEREVHAYKELRYSSAQFDSVPSQPGVNRIHSRGEFEVYYIPDESATE